MSWLNQIYESVLTEITADEAYPRFYQQKMSREDFDRILDGHEVDKFYRFFLFLMCPLIALPILNTFGKKSIFPKTNKK